MLKYSPAPSEELYITTESNESAAASRRSSHGLDLKDLDKDNKALGLGYLAEEYRLYIMTSINFSKRKKKMRVGQNLLKEEVIAKTPNPLTRRQLLSQVAGLYDLIGLVTPVKQKGAILVRIQMHFRKQDVETSNQRYMA